MEKEAWAGASLLIYEMDKLAVVEAQQPWRNFLKSQLHCFPN